MIHGKSQLSPLTSVHEFSFVCVRSKQNWQLPVLALCEQILWVLAERVELAFALCLCAWDGTTEAQGSLGTFLGL